MGKYRFVGSVAAAVVIADRLTKWYIDSTFAVHESVAVIDPVFHITHLRNTGGAFSILAGQNPAIRLPFFLTVSALAIGVIVYFLRQIEPCQRLLLFALAGMLGGAVGNLIDRVLFGEVIDFLDFHWRQYHWPPFNVADSFITIGACILVLESFTGRPLAGKKTKSIPGGKQ